MKKHRHMAAGIAGALLIGTCLTPAFGAGVTIGGTSSGGTTATATAGTTSGSVSIGGGTATGAISTANPATSTTVTVGGDGNVATGRIGSGDPTTDTTVSIGNTEGPLATVDTDGQTTDAAVNLGALLSAIEGIDVNPTVPDEGNSPGNGNDGVLASAYGYLSAGDQQVLKVKCRDVLARPGGFKLKLVALCKMIASL